MKLASYLVAMEKSNFIKNTVMAMSLVATTAEAKLTNRQLEDAMLKPLIIGASISANYGTDSPSRRLALRYTEPNQITTHAFGGNPGIKVLESLNEDILKDRTVILGMDLFFWDSALPNPTASVSAIKNLVAKAKKKDIPIVLGEVPELIPGRQPQRSKINDTLKDVCDDYKKCYLIPFIDLHRKVIRERGISIDGKLYTFKELVPDGLHLSDLAGDYLADVMKNVMMGKRP